MNYSRAIHTLLNSLKISVNIFKYLVIILYTSHKLVKPYKKMSSTELYSAIKAADRRIDNVLKDYTKCKNNAILADVIVSETFDNEINDLIAQVKYEFDYLNYIFYALDSGLDTSMIANYDTAEGKLATINSKLEFIEAYCEFIRFCLNSHNKAS